MAWNLLSSPTYCEDWYIYEHDMTTEDLNFFGTEGYFVVGDDGVVLFCEYSTSLTFSFDKTFVWEDVSAPTSEDLFGVCNASDTHVVGTSGTILYYEYWDWTFIDSPTTKDLYSITLSVNSFEGFVVGAEGTILYGGGDPPVWELYESSPTDQDLYSVCGDRPYPNTTWAVGAGGTILDYEDGVWSLYPSSPTTMDLYGVYVSQYTGNAWACGGGGTIIFWDGTSWSLQDTPTTEDLYSIWYEYWPMYCVGANGTILRSENDGLTWELDNCPVTVDLHGVAGYTPFWAVGENGTILSRDWCQNIQPTSIGYVKALFAPSVEAVGAKDDVK